MALDATLRMQHLHNVLVKRRLLMRQRKSPLSNRMITRVTMDAGSQVSLWKKLRIGDTPFANATVGVSSSMSTRHVYRLLFIVIGTPRQGTAKVRDKGGVKFTRSRQT